MKTGQFGAPFVGDRALSAVAGSPLEAAAVSPATLGASPGSRGGLREAHVPLIQ